MAIFVGGMAAVEPRRARDLGALGLRALLAATLACLMTGAIAGIFYTGKDTVLLKKKPPVAGTSSSLPAQPSNLQMPVSKPLPRSH